MMSFSPFVVAALLCVGTAIATDLSPAGNAANDGPVPPTNLSYHVGGDLNYLKDPMARALDGTPAAYYYIPGRSTKKLMLWLSGGGICYTPDMCLLRAMTDLGSSHLLPKNITKNRQKGVASRNCTVNPTFCDFTFIDLAYLDGMLYASQRLEPQNVSIGSQVTKQLYYRGQFNLKAILQVVIDLGNKWGIEELVWSGDSAGGAGTSFFASRGILMLLDAIPTLRKAVSMPVSGLFVNTHMINGQDITFVVATSILSLGNCTPSFSSECLADNQGLNEWRCGIPAVGWNYTSPKVPTFALQSFLDAWQVCNLLLANPNELERNLNQNGLQNARGCGSQNPLYAHTGCPNIVAPERPNGTIPKGALGKCNATQAKPLLAYQNVVYDFILNSAPMRRNNSGAAVVSCLTHTAAQSDPHWLRTQIPFGNAANTWHAIADRWWKSLGNVTRGITGKDEYDNNPSSSKKDAKKNPQLTMDNLRTMEDPNYESNPSCNQ